MMLLLASVMEVVVAMMEAAGEVGSSWDGDLNRVQKLNSDIHTFRGHCTVKHHKRIRDFAWMQVEICRNTARISAPCPEIEF